MNIRITKQFRFEMAHALYGYDGPCKNIHGHSYRLSVTVKGAVLNDNSTKTGMVMDFTDLKKIVSPIISELDHALIVNGGTAHKSLAGNENFEKIILAAYQPTCENLLCDIAKRIGPQLPLHLVLHHLKLEETATSFAEWYAEDNVNVI